MYCVQVLGKRVQGLSEGLESAAVQCSLERDTVQQMKKQLREIQDFVGVRLYYLSLSLSVGIETFPTDTSWGL